jgi:hypothetical protein
VAVSIVAALRPEWLKVSVNRAARASGVDPAYVSRLARRFRAAAEKLLARLTRRGRKPTRPSAAAAAELRKAKALLVLATAALRSRGKDLRALVTGAFDRLEADLGISATELCAALALSERTFRAWRAAPPAATPDATAPAPTPPKRSRSPRRPRFHFDVMLGGVQFGADTTAVRVFGVDLKLVGVQDIGGRDSALLDAVVVDTTESAAHVKAAFAAALAACPGAQMVTDQGTPYMAEATVDVLRDLDVEHAPQKEGDPCGKSTVERSFKSLKDVLAPLLDLSNFLADRFAPLRDHAIAVPFTRLVTGVVLRAYQAGARAARRTDDARGGAVTEDTLVRAAARAREDARATDRSARLWLGDLHAQLRFPGSAHAFVDQFRRFPLTALKDAERALRQRLLLKDDVRDLWRYFAVLARSAKDAFFRDRDARAGAADLAARARSGAARVDAERSVFRDDPVRWLHAAFDLLAQHWLPETRELLFGGVGPGSGNLVAALAHLARTRGPQATEHIARAVLQDFLRDRRPRLGDDGGRALAAVLDRHLRSLPRADDEPRLADVLRGATPTCSRGGPPQPLIISTA